MLELEACVARPLIDLDPRRVFVAQDCFQRGALDSARAADPQPGGGPAQTCGPAPRQCEPGDTPLNFLVGVERPRRRPLMPQSGHCRSKMATAQSDGFLSVTGTSPPIPAIRGIAIEPTGAAFASLFCAGADPAPIQKPQSAPVSLSSYGRASRIMLNGVSVARLTLRKPPAVMTSHNLASPACAPSAAPTS